MYSILSYIENSSVPIRNRLTLNNPNIDNHEEDHTQETVKSEYYE